MFKEDEGMFYRRITPRRNGKEKSQKRINLLLFGLEFGKMILLPKTGNGWKQWQKI